MRIYGEITKLEPQDDGTLKVTGVASSGAVDQADERIAPSAMKAALPDYMSFRRPARDAWPIGGRVRP